MKTVTSGDIIKISSKNLDFSTGESSYSPMFSTVGLQVEPNTNGIGELYFHYNRATRSLCGKLFDFPVALNKNESDICGLVFGQNDRKLKLSFYGADAFTVEADGIERIPVFCQPEAEYWTEAISEKEIRINGYSKNGDGRDPDEKVGFLIALKAENGKLFRDGNGIFFEAENGKISFGFFFQALEISEEKIAEKFKEKNDFSTAKNACEKWFCEYTKRFAVNAENETEELLIATAVFGLMFNTAKAQGMLSKYISAFPSRGSYPTHFIWDTYFQNLAYEKMNPVLAKDFLLQILANQRPDGKCPQFMCSTWARPHDTQPALFGWAAKRLLRIIPDRKAFIHQIADGLEKNNRWWLTQRMTEYGCIFCPGGLETGQDNSPRFDNGETLAVDMNSYLLYQLKFTSEIFEETGDKIKADFWKRETEKLREKIIENLYDEDKNIFFDFCLASKKKVEIISPSSMLPLWAGIKLGDEKEKAMIEKYLINPQFMFGDVPFPSIAYTEAEYNPEDWWRGPTWLPVAWLMLEILDGYGYNKEYETAIRRLHGMIVRDKKMHELFNSKTGEGMGSVQQGWSCAVFIRLCEIINKQG